MKNVVILANENFYHYFRRNYNLVEKRSVLYKNGNKIINFDFALTIDDRGNDIKNLCKIANKPFIGIERYEKSMQIALLQNGGINVPETVKCFKSGIECVNSYIELEELLSYFSDDELIVVKDENGACGMRQALGKKEAIMNLIFDGKTENIRFGNFDKDKDFTTIKDSGTYKDLKNNTNVFFQKFIKNTTEFRILYFYDEPFIIVKRNEDENGSWQKNHQVTKNSKLVISDPIITQDVENKIRTFFDKFNSPFFALDLYYDHDKEEWGIYEFQMQFGTKSIPLNTMIERSYNSIEKLVKKLS